VKRVLAIATIALVAAGCGGGKAKLVRTGPKGIGVQPTFQLTADAHKLQFDKKLIQAGAGPVHLVMVNPSSTPHNIAIKGKGVNVKGPVVQNGSQSAVTVTLKPGVYEFYCSVDGHEQAGMKGTLRVGNARVGSGSP
jgi:uncharacterized cupredoxin-like copper-binding protein